MKITNTKIVGKTLQKIADAVTSTMGAKGRFAVLNQDMDRPLITDDGVTVAREFYHLDDPFEKMIAVSLIEAASNTEREAFDGTTLTVLLTNELYKQGCKWIRRGMHPQQAADKIQELIALVREGVKNNSWKPDDKQILQLATISSKIPAVGDLVHRAWKLAGDDMNVVIEHNRETRETSVTREEGLVLDYGWDTEVLRMFCNQGDKTVFEKAWMVMLAEQTMTHLDIKKFFNSIPQEHLKDPFVFVLTPKFNPEAMKIILDILAQNQFQFQFIFLNDEDMDNLYADVAAKTQGTVQDASYGTSQYEFKHCGFANKILIEKNKTIIIAEGSVDGRVAVYKDIFAKHTFDLSVPATARYTRRLSSLQAGLVKIKLHTSTATEYQLLRMKLDDSIGAVRKAIQSGVTVGAGMALPGLLMQHHIIPKGEVEGSNFVSTAPLSKIKNVLWAANKQIMKNAGLKWKNTGLPGLGYDVLTGKKVTLVEAGIIDSAESIDAALKNAASISAQYLRAFVLITR